MTSNALLICLILSEYKQKQSHVLMLAKFCILQIKTFKPEVVGLRNESLIDELKEALADVDHKPEIIPGEQGVIEVEIFFICFASCHLI